MNGGTTPGSAPRGTRWLSQDFSVLAQELDAKTDAAPSFDLVIVGSGYGGAMAAAQFGGSTTGSGSPVRVAVLERGREYLPGSFPSRFADLAGNVRFSVGGQPEPKGPREGLFDVRLGGDVSALLGNGLGGGSLINAAVMAKPQFDQFDSGLPPAMEQELSARYECVKAMLGARVNHDGKGVDNTIALHPVVQAKPLPKREALTRIGTAAGGTTTHAPITIEMAGGTNAQGVHLNACSLCGDCMTGCNVGARKSLDTNLLVQAKQHGAEIYTGVSVMQIEWAGDHWLAEVVYTDKGLREKRGPTRVLRTRKLVLAAGSFGSTEILLRSQRKGLRFSPRLGERFSCNGDNIAAVYAQREPVESAADEATPLVHANGAPARHIGPTITGIVSMPAQDGNPPYLVQEFAVPAALKRLFAELVTTGDMLRSLASADLATHVAGGAGLDPLAVDPEAIRRTSVIGLIGHDAACGSLKLPPGYVPSARSRAVPAAYEGSLQVVWPEADRDAAVVRAYERVAEGVEQRGSGRMVANPVWRPLPKPIQEVLSTGAIRGSLLTVHPLGGCPIGADWRDGVVDEYGAVFDAQRPASSASWQGSLLVLDGAILPGSLGANPALTIATVALRAAEHWRDEWRWQRADASAARPVGPRPVYRDPEDCTEPVSEPTHVQVVERLVGKVVLGDRGFANNEFVLEMTLGFRPKSLASLCRLQKRTLRVGKAHRGDLDDANRLRLYAASDWENLRLDGLEDHQRAPHALATARLVGRMHLLDRAPTTFVERCARGLWAYLLNRGGRDIWQFKFDPRQNDRDAPGAVRRMLSALKLATHAGEVRRLDYDLKLKDVKLLDARAPLLPEGARVRGGKRFTYEIGGNPWNQLLYLRLTDFPGLLGAAQLKLDAAFLARKGVALFRVTKQSDAPTALADMASFLAYFVRLLVSVHMWSFRYPDVPNERTPQRLPGAVPGLPPPEIREIDLERRREPVRVRLTRYRGTSVGLPPLVLIHGYSASGTTFAHPDLDPGMARYFWDRGRDVWILDLRTSAGMPTAVQPWSFEQVARSDIPVAIEHIVQQVQRERGGHAVKVDVFAHCIGAVMLSMALLTNARRPARSALAQLPNRIRRVVLSQKGPALAYSDANVLRAFVLRFLRPLLLPDGYQFRPPASPSTADQLLDRFLASMPYPPEEYLRENPRQLCARTPWIGTRHRMDALYERTFSVNNLSDVVLEKIDDFFGPLNVDTVTQTIHFARNRTITNRSGRNVFVSLRNFARWPREGTLSIHGADNGMVSTYTLELMRRTMARAQVPFATRLLPGVGHQDCLIGTGARDTFEAVEEFLDARDPPGVPALAAPPVLHPPWVGPRIVRAPSVPQQVKRISGSAEDVRENGVHVVIGADPARAEAFAAAIPVRQEGGKPLPLPLAQTEFGTVAIAHRPGWMEIALPDPLPQEATGIAILVGYGEAVRLPRSVVEGELARLAEEERQAQEQGPTQRCLWLLERKALERVAQDPPHELKLLLASCQYPMGILDGRPAAASLRRMEGAVGKGRADAVLLVGDQIYADATAGLLDPARADDRYTRSYEEWLRTPALRHVMRKVPVHTTLDDHELMDNWEPGSGSLSATPQERARTVRTAIREFWRYQRAAVPQRYAGPAWYQVRVGAFEVFMADTRSTREARPAAGARIMDPVQARKIELWLANQQASDFDVVRPKFLACGVWLAPPKLGQPGRPEAAARCDAWDGYPRSQQELLKTLVDRQVRGLVVLAGDAHLGCVAELTVSREDGGRAPVKVLCIHTPALYGPYPFANARPEDYIEAGAARFDGYRVEWQAHWMPGGDGFVELHAHRSGGMPWRLDAALNRAGGVRPVGSWAIG